MNIVAPHPWARTGPGKALDGKPKFNLDTFDPAYFKRLRSRVQAAGERGIYGSVRLTLAVTVIATPVLLASIIAFDSALSVRVEFVVTFESSIIARLVPS